MPPASSARRIVNCSNCGRRMTLVTGDPSTACQDRGSCEARRTTRSAIGSAPALAAGAVVSPIREPLPDIEQPVFDEEGNEEAPPEPGSARDIAIQQRSLAIRAVSLTSLTMDQIQNVLENGVDVVQKDGSVITQDVQPMALASLMRELRPIVHEPVRAHEAKTTIDRPLLQINLADTDVVRDAVLALRSRRERQLDARQPMQLPRAIALPRQSMGTPASTETDND